MKTSDIKDRLKYAMELFQIKQTELVKVTGIDKGQLSSYLSGKYEPRQNNIFILAEALNVSEAWLIGYNVPMERNTTYTVQTLTAEEIDYINKYRLLDTPIKTLVNTILDAEYLRISSKHKKSSETKKYTKLTPDPAEPISKAAEPDGDYNLNDKE
jgi:Helix-turn-helix.